MSEQKQKQSDMAGVTVGVVANANGARAVAVHFTAGESGTTLILPDDLAVNFFETLGMTLESLGLLEEEMHGGAQCRTH